MAKLTKVQQLAMIGVNDLKKMPTDELLKTLGTFSRSYKKRKKSLSQSGKTTTSIRSMEKKNPFSGTSKELKKEYKNDEAGLKNRVINEIKKYKSFFNPNKKAKKQSTSQPQLTEKETKPTKPKTGFERAPKKQKETKAEKLAQKDIEEFGKYKTDPASLKQMEKDLRTLQQGYIRRAKQLKDSPYYSKAVLGMEDFTEPYLDSIAELRKEYKGRPAAWRNRMLSEISIFHNFFNNQTSTLEGAYKENLEQDKRIFGTDEQGNPLRSMTKDERKTFWNVFNEYENTYPTRTPQSNDIIRKWGGLFDELGIDIPNWDDMEEKEFDLVGLLNTIEQIMKGKTLDEIKKEQELFGTANQVYAEDLYD